MELQRRGVAFAETSQAFPPSVRWKRQARGCREAWKNISSLPPSPRTPSLYYPPSPSPTHNFFLEHRKLKKIIYKRKIKSRKPFYLAIQCVDFTKLARRPIQSLSRNVCVSWIIMCCAKKCIFMRALLLPITLVLGWNGLVP